MTDSVEMQHVVGCRRVVSLSIGKQLIPTLVTLAAVALGQLVITPVTSTAQTVAMTKPAVIAGTVVGSDGRPMSRADIVMRAVHSQDPDGAPDIARTRADSRGHFAIASTYTGGVILYFFGASHDAKVVSLDLSAGYQLQMRVQLARVRYVANLDSVRVAGDYNTFRADTSARLLQRNAAGVYAIDIPVKSDTMAYVLVRLTPRGTTNGISNDVQTFTGTGYRTLARVSGGFAHIAIDPTRIVHDTTPARVEYTGGAEARAARISDSLSSHQEFYVKMTGSGKTADNATWAPPVRRAMNDLSIEKSPMVREMLLLELLQLTQLGGAVPSRIGRIALNELPPNASAWTTRQSLVYGLPLLPQWIADSVVHLMRPVAVEVLSPADSSRLRASAAKLSARFDSSAIAATNDGAQAQWMQWGVAATYGLIPERSAEILSRMQAQHPTRYLTQFALQIWGSNQKLRKSAPLPPLDVASVADTTKRITNSQIAGKTVLIDFWATWCGPCLEEMPYLHEAYKEFAAKGLEILSVSANDSVGEISTYRAKRWPMPWLNGWVSGGMRGAQFKDFDIYALSRVVRRNSAAEKQMAHVALKAPWAIRFPA